MASICRTEAIIWPTLALLADTSYGDFINPKLTVAFFYIYFSAHKRLGVVKRRTTKQNEISAIDNHPVQDDQRSGVPRAFTVWDGPWVCCPSHPLLPLASTVALLSYCCPSQPLLPPTPRGKKKSRCQPQRGGENIVVTTWRRGKTCSQGPTYTTSSPHTCYATVFPQHTNNLVVSKTEESKLNKVQLLFTL